MVSEVGFNNPSVCRVYEPNEDMKLSETMESDMSDESDWSDSLPSEFDNKNTNRSTNVINPNTLIMFPKSSLTVNDIILMITAFSLKFGCSVEARLKLMQMFKRAAGPDFERVTVSNYKLDQIFQVPNEIIKAHYYCAKCFLEIHADLQENFKKKEVVCQKFNNKYLLTLSSENCFYTIQLKFQLTELMKIEQIQSKLDNLTILKINFSTDGAPIFHKSKRSMWPLQIILQDLPPELRFKYVTIVGLMI